MSAMFRNTAIGAAALGLCVGLALPAQAAYIVTLQQVGANVVATGSGTLGLAALGTPAISGDDNAGINPSLASIGTGPASPVPIDGYTGMITGPTSLGTKASGIRANSGSGDIVRVFGNPDTFGAPALFVPSGYVSGTALSDTSTYNTATFASLGVTPGTYEWTWGTGATADSFTLQIGAAAVPEPASLPLLSIGLAGLGLVLRTRRA